jgi:ABC-type spermidine/putrescine transport system permease subunit II
VSAWRDKTVHWQQRATDAGLVLWYFAVVVFLFTPLAAAVVYSFNMGVLNKQTAALTGWTWKWYAAAWNDMSLRRSVRVSLLVALWSALLSVIIGSALGYALVRHPRSGIRRFLAMLVYSLLIVPESVTGVSLLLFYSVTRVPLGLGTLIVGITPVAIAVVALIVRARMLTLDRQLEEAAADLGSARAQTLWFIVLPQLVPSIAVGGVMAYTLCFDNLVVSTFLTTPQFTTLPVYLYGSLQYGPSPAVYAAASIVFALSVLMLALVVALHQLTRPL